MGRVCTGPTGRWKPCFVSYPIFTFTFNPVDALECSDTQRAGVSFLNMGCLLFLPCSEEWWEWNSWLFIYFQGDTAFMSISTRCFVSSAGQPWPNIYMGTVLCHYLIYFRWIVILLLVSWCKRELFTFSRLTPADLHLPLWGGTFATRIKCVQWVGVTLDWHAMRSWMFVKMCFNLDTAIPEMGHISAFIDHRQFWMIYNSSIKTGCEFKQLLHMQEGDRVNLASWKECYHCLWRGSEKHV